MAHAHHHSSNMRRVIIALVLTGTFMDHAVQSVVDRHELVQATTPDITEVITFIT